MHTSEVVMLAVIVMALVGAGWVLRKWYLLSMGFVRSFWDGEL